MPGEQSMQGRRIHGTPVKELKITAKYNSNENVKYDRNNIYIYNAL